MKDEWLKLRRESNIKDHLAHLWEPLPMPHMRSLCGMTTTYWGLITAQKTYKHCLECEKLQRKSTP